MTPSKQHFRLAIGVVGAARVGLALSHQIALNGYDVILLTTIEERMHEVRATRRVPSVLPELEQLHARVHITMDPQEIANNCTLLFVTISDYLLNHVAELLGQHLDGAHMIVHATHSLYGDILQRGSQVLEENTCVKQIGVLAGPIHMSELLASKPNVALVASEFPGVIERARKALANDVFHLYASADVRGVEYAAALHQIVALAIGMADGLHLGSATHAAFAAAGLSEISRIGVTQGAQPDSFYGVVGVGRIVDALQRGGPNYSLGVVLADAPDRARALKEAPLESKGPEVVAQLMAWAEHNGMSLPFTSSIARILKGADMEEELRALMLKQELFAPSQSTHPTSL